MQGKSAMAFLLSNYYPVYCSTANTDFGMAMLPRMDDGVQSGMYLNSNMYWCISANSANPEAAAAVLNCPIEHFPPILRREHDVIFAIPPCMC